MANDFPKSKEKLVSLAEKMENENPEMSSFLHEYRVGVANKPGIRSEGVLFTNTPSTYFLYRRMTNFSKSLSPSRPCKPSLAARIRTLYT